jgi:hypothetical protein
MRSIFRKGDQEMAINYCVRCLAPQIEVARSKFETQQDFETAIRSGACFIYGFLYRVADRYARKDKNKQHVALCVFRGLFGTDVAETIGAEIEARINTVEGWKSFKEGANGARDFEKENILAVEEYLKGAAEMITMLRR